MQNRVQLESGDVRGERGGGRGREGSRYLSPLLVSGGTEGKAKDF